MDEWEVTIQSDGASLAGTICSPGLNQQCPAVLMIHGSGPLDRNENIKGQRIDSFNTIAHALAEHGIASLRYDKRGCGESSGDFLTAGHSDLLRDGLQCLDTLATSTCVHSDQIFILGHSEGCIIAPQISRHRPAVAGLILLCPFIEKIESILTRQAVQIEKEINSFRGIRGAFQRGLFRVIGTPQETQQRLIGKARETDSPIVRAGFSPHPGKWLRELLALDTNAIFASTHTPMLLIGGEKDLQCDPQDVYRIAKIAPGESEASIIDGMTHFLRIDENSPTITGAALQLDEPLASAVIEKTLRWILARSAMHRQSHARDQAGH